MSKYSKVLEFLVENGVVLDKNQIRDLKKIFNKNESIENEQIVTDSEVLTESVVCKNKGKYNMSISINRSFKDTNYIKDPYIKVFDGPDPDHCSKLARISLLKMEYVTHYKDSNHPEKWELNSKEKAELNNIMKSKGKKNPTVWEDLLSDMSREFGVDKSYFENMFTEVPDFSKLQNK